MNPTDSFDFINDLSVRGKILEAIEMTAVLYLNLKQNQFSSLVAKELRRMIILYNASIVEALLLHLYKRGNFQITRSDYVHAQTLSPHFQTGMIGEVFIAEKVDIPRRERELMLDILLKFFHNEGLVLDDLKTKIDSTRTVRNTFHLSKSRRGIGCGMVTVHRSATAVYETAQMVRNQLR